jgi:hypothetical protein
MDTEQERRLERMGYSRGPGESDAALHERVAASMQYHLTYGTKDWYAKRALDASWWVKTVSVETAADDDRLARNTVYIEVWGPRLFGYQFPVRQRTLDKVDAALRPDLPINMHMVVLDGRP